ncbi:MAG: hypothetical protein JWQ71_3384 [Pedosphaera sp.]|nr:hypothetical protein [Pedosphaera sp.]
MLAYLFPDSKITVSQSGEVRITGMLAPYRTRIAWFIKELDLKDVTIRYWSKRFYFPKTVDEGTRQRLRNFFSAEVPITQN